MRRIVYLVSINLMVAGLLLCLLEGAASLTRFTYRAVIGPSLSERKHTEHDADLGWVNLANATIPNMYGDGRNLVTNAQRFRNDTDFEARPPRGRMRAICSGDSFTLGYGVSDADTWCQQLEEIEPTLQTVNMGQGGYGIDQIYLWYKRDGTRLQHDLHLFSFITEDIARMQLDDFLGYPKPRLAVVDDRLEAANVPVRKPSRLEVMYHMNFYRFSDLSIARLARKLVGARDPSTPVDASEDARPILSAIIDSFRRTPTARWHVLVHMPALEDYTGHRSDPWRRFFREEALRQGVPYIDLIEAFRALPPDTIEDLYIGAHDTEYLGAPGHLNERGNRLVARLLLERLESEIPELEAVLASGRASEKTLIE